MDSFDTTACVADNDAASDVFGPDAPQAATALASVRARKTPQSTNPGAVAAAVQDARAWAAGRLGVGS